MVHQEILKRFFIQQKREVYHFFDKNITSKNIKADIASK